MLAIPELAMSRRRNVTTVCNGEKITWSDREEAENFFLWSMMIAEENDYDRLAGIYIQLQNGLVYCTDEDE